MDIRIYYEDTDAAGIVYHSNYLKYFERARTEYFREKGYSVAKLAALGIIFPIIHVEIDFLAPGIHDDELTIKTRPMEVSGSSFTMCHQAVRKIDRMCLAKAEVKMACVNPQLKARRIPVEIRTLLQAACDTTSRENWN